MKTIFTKLNLTIVIFVLLMFILPGKNIIHSEKVQVSNMDIYIEDSIVPLVFTTGNTFFDNRNLYVPVREFVGFLGGKTDWDPVTRDIKIIDNNDSCVLSLDENKQIYEMLIIQNGRSYLPYEILTKRLGYESLQSSSEIRISTTINYQNNINSKLPEPNPFTPFADSGTYLKSSPNYDLDSEGVFIYDYGSRYENASKQYNPAFISSYAFSLYRDYLDSNQIDIKKRSDFISQADWIVKNKVDYGKFYAWEYNFDNLKFNAIAPWRSGMANGRVLSVMTKAYALTGEKKYLNTAEKAFKAFLIDTRDYGMTTFIPNGTAYYEEVADTEAFSSKILNGHIFALSGIYDYWKATGRKDVKLVLDKGVNAIKNDIDLYDADFLSYYSQEPSNPRIFAPTNNYNMLHVHQLLWLYDITDEQIFLSKAMKFYEYEMKKTKVSTKGSTNANTNGPENLKISMGTNYWSHNSFPTWVELDLEEQYSISGIKIMGYFQQASPRDINISYSDDGINWSLIKELRDNKDQYLLVEFETIETRYLKVDILNDNGNNNVSLTGVGVIFNDEKLAKSISSFSNFTSSNSAYKIFDGNINTKLNIKEDGWIIINNSDDIKPISSIYISTDLPENELSEIEVFVSDDLSDWVTIDKFSINNKNKELFFNEKISTNFFKIEYNKNIRNINEIILK